MTLWVLPIQVTRNMLAGKMNDVPATTFLLLLKTESDETELLLYIWNIFETLFTYIINMGSTVTVTSNILHRNVIEHGFVL